MPWRPCRRCSARRSSGVPRVGPAARRLTSYWPRTLRPRKASMNPSCWLPTVRFSQRDIARRRGVRPLLLPRASCVSIRSKRTLERGHVQVDPLSRSTTAGISSASGSCDPISSATIGSILQGRAVELLRLGALGGRASAPRPTPSRRWAMSRTASQSMQPCPGPAHDLARGDAGAESEQPADDDPRAGTGAVCVCHGPQSTGTRRDRLDLDRFDLRQPLAEEPSGDGDEGIDRSPLVATRWPARRSPPALGRRARREGPRPPAPS